MLGVGYALAGAIGGYQRWISPYKGFHCAHWTLHGGESCSAFRRMAIERGLLGCFRGMRARFADCRRASQALRARRDLLICLASHATPVTDGKAADDAEAGEDEPARKDGKRTSGGWWWADCNFVPSSCDFDLPSCDCSW